MTESYQEQAKKLINKFETRLYSFIISEQEMLSNYHNVFGNEHPEKIIKILAENPRYMESFILNKDGRVQYASDPIRVGYNYQGRDIYELGTSAREPIFNTRFHPFENSLYIDLIIPFFSSDDELLYIAVHKLNPGWFEKELEKEHIDVEGDVIMFDHTGIIFLKIQSKLEGIEDRTKNKPASLFDYGFSYERIKNVDPGINSFICGDNL
ncbi:hypothetical protein [Desulfitispora alkaliphila]|uniref:hypothetical protein n=1 Tax=Desulfitispora alkaliphila TaxID=622674 RepID=UPI003D21BDE7